MRDTTKKPKIMKQPTLRKQLSEFIGQEIQNAKTVNEKALYKAYRRSFCDCSAANHQVMLCPKCRMKRLAPKIQEIKHFLTENRTKMTICSMKIVLFFSKQRAADGYREYFDRLSRKLRNAKTRNRQTVLGYVRVPRVTISEKTGKIVYSVHLIVGVKKLDDEICERVQGFFEDVVVNGGRLTVKFGRKVYKDKKNSLETRDEDREKLVDELEKWPCVKTIGSFAPDMEEYKQNFIASTGCFREYERKAKRVEKPIPKRKILKSHKTKSVTFNKKSMV